MAYLREQVEAIAAQDRRVRLDDAGSVHQMRVAIRRLRSGLRVFRQIVSPPDTTALAAELKWLAGILGSARDQEVLRARFAERLLALPAELLWSDVGQRLDDRCASRQASARDAVLAALRGQRYRLLRSTLEKLLADPPFTTLAAGRAEPVLPALVGKAWLRLDRAHAAVDEMTPGPERDRLVHQVRKAAKRFRYAVEATLPVVGEEAERTLGHVKALQELLGHYQDGVVAMSELRCMAAQVHHAADGRSVRDGFTLGALCGVEWQHMCRALDGLAVTWRRLAEPRQLRWLRV